MFWHLPVFAIAFSHAAPSGLVIVCDSHPGLTPRAIALRPVGAGIGNALQFVMHLEKDIMCALVMNMLCDAENKPEL